MTTAAVRKKLIDYAQTADAKSVKKLYSIIENNMENVAGNEYSEEFKRFLDEQYEYVMNGGKLISAEEVDKQIKKILVNAEGK